MIRKSSRLAVLLMAAMFVLSGCRLGTDDSVLRDGGGTEGPIGYSSLERLLADMTVAKFDEADRFRNAVAADLLPLRALYMPRKVPESFSLSRIWSFSFSGNLPIVFDYVYNYNAYSRASFTWLRDNLTDEVSFWQSERQGGVDRAHRSQHGYKFRAEGRFPASFTDQELYDFSYAQPVTTWEMQGNAISVSIQGMGGVRIFDGAGYEIVISPTVVDYRGLYLANRHFLEHHTLYRTDSENRNVIGYRWSLDLELDRWQYVLEPGIYTFHVEGIIRDEIGLLVRHFDDHEIVLSVDYGAELTRDVSSFTITVTPMGSYLTINEN